MLTRGFKYFTNIDIDERGERDSGFNQHSRPAAITSFENVSREVHSSCIVLLFGRTIGMGLGLLQVSKTISLVWQTNFIYIALKRGNKILVQQILTFLVGKGKDNVFHDCSLAIFYVDVKDVRKKIDETCTPQVFEQTLQHVAHIQDGFHTFQLAHLGHRF